ncbi:MAG TPA: hypothetical protein VFX16_32015 [Pseudonocardiaceae bacterium]|nr:hypothetical protein [Pseudonocardiaceae bacterium]
MTTSPLNLGEPRDQAIAERLTLEFEPSLPPTVVRHTLVEAGRDLAGQIAPEAWDEMVYRLAQYRLGRLTAENTQR